jgi:asparagine synthase (glutamine-hydrolysing)
MSGIVGILSLTSKPISPSILEKLTASLYFRGPDAQQIWQTERVGFGHTLLRVNDESQAETQPLTLGDLTIVADVRLDGRAELCQQLGVATHLPDVNLFLYAYLHWGEQCVEHLYGDFTFAIWDARHQQLFCGRDHFGVKPFYYALLEDIFVFSNTLPCLWDYPGFSKKINSQAVADFFLSGFNQNLATTYFSAIQRLPPAHSLTLAANGNNGHPQIRRYWELKPQSRSKSKDDQAIRVEFLHHFRQAITDRLRTQQIAVYMSGGMDSSTIAAIAHEQGRHVKAFTGIYESLFNDPEKYYAGLVAEHLQIPIEYQICDGYELFEEWQSPKIRFAQPRDNAFMKMNIDGFEMVKSHARVLLYGSGGDDVLGYTSRYFWNLLRQQGIFQWSWEALHYGLVRRHLPPLYIRTSLQQRRKKRWQFPVPSWLNPDWKQTLHLEEYVARMNSVFHTHPKMPYWFHTDAYRGLTRPLWSDQLEHTDLEAAYFGIETRRPFLDVRLIEYVFSLSQIDWCIDKSILRQTMVGYLPQAVLQRKKELLVGEPVFEKVKSLQVDWAKLFAEMPMLEEYMSLPQLQDAYTNMVASEDRYLIYLNLRALTFAKWLKQSLG